MNRKIRLINYKTEQSIVLTPKNVNLSNKQGIRLFLNQLSEILKELYKASIEDIIDELVRDIFLKLPKDYTFQVQSEGIDIEVQIFK